MGKFCSKCGAEIDKGAKFCIGCGAHVEEENVQQAPAEPVAQKTPTPPPPPKNTVQKAIPPVTQNPIPKKSNTMKIFAVIAVVAIVIIAAFAFGFMMGGSDSGTLKGTEDYGVIMGRVKNTNGYMLGDVSVKADGNLVETNDQGWFSLSNIDANDRVIVDFEKDDYATTHKVVDVNSGDSSFIDIYMSPVDTSTSFNSQNGATITTSNGGSINIGANDIAYSNGNAYTGTVQADVTVFDPSDEEDAGAFPGEYLGLSNGEYVPIKSFGFIDVTLTDQSGNELDIKSGETATVTVPVPTSMQSEASSMGSCPLWYFDTDSGYWIEEGQGTYDSNSKSFTGTVTHFSTWNYDVAYPRAYISGRVVNSAGTPVAGAIVNCWGTGWKYSKWASGETSTASDGTFTKIPVECTVIFKYQASKGGYDSSEYTIPRALACDEEYDVGDIVLGSVASAQITLTWDLNPDDLDSHLVIPAYSENEQFHLYYPYSMDSGYDFSDSYPHANLDTDDTTSYGPEVVTILQMHPGTYRYCVRHFAGTGDIENSGAEINVIIQGVGIYKFTPPSNQEDGTDVWRVFDIVVDSSGMITAVNTINDYVTGYDESEVFYP